MTFIGSLTWSVRDTVLISQNSLFICEETFPPKKKKRVKETWNIWMQAGRHKITFPPGPFLQQTLTPCWQKLLIITILALDERQMIEKKDAQLWKVQVCSASQVTGYCFSQLPGGGLREAGGCFFSCFTSSCLGKEKKTPDLSTQRWSPKTLFG